MNYEFHPEAEWEFIEEAARYEAEVPGLGHHFGSEVERVIELLLENPKIGAPVDDNLRHGNSPLNSVVCDPSEFSGCHG